MFKKVLFLLLITLISCGKSFNDYPSTPIEQVNFLEHSETKTENGLTVTTSVLTIEESNKIFGVNLFEKGIQPVWVEIKNDSDYDFIFLPISIDPEFFAPNEVAFLFQSMLNGGTVHPQLSKRFNDYGYELSKINPGETNKGFVYTNYDPGIKYVNVSLFSEEQIESFVFYHIVRDSGHNIREIDFEAIYTNDKFISYKNESDFIQAIKNLPCCLNKKDNNQDKDVFPINFIFIGTDEDVFSALIRRGWDVTEPDSDFWSELDIKKYFTSPLFRTSPMENLYYFGRQQDVSLQKSRRNNIDTIRQRNEMRIWLSPLKYMGKNVWIGSTTRDIGTDVTKFGDFFTKRIDPDLNETRSYLSEDMALSQNINKIGWIKKHEQTTRQNPNINYMGQTLWSDGHVLVLYFQEIPTSMTDITFYEWDYPFSLKEPVNKNPGQVEN